MGEIEPTIGPVASPENIRRHERTTADVDKFKEQMKLKMTQVDESDAEQQKKRKQQAEKEDEQETLPEPETTPASQVTPFDLHKQVSPMDMQEGGRYRRYPPLNRPNKWLHLPLHPPSWKHLRLELKIPCGMKNRRRSSMCPHRQSPSLNPNLNPSLNLGPPTSKQRLLPSKASQNRAQHKRSRNSNQ